MKINEGDFLFSYNTKYSNNLIQNNIDLDDLFYKKKFEDFKCKDHHKHTTIDCFNCDEDICLYDLKKFI